MVNAASSVAQMSGYRSPSSALVEETKILFNHQGSDSELMQQITIAIQAINTLNEKPAA
jgi:hypothetical protein